MKELDILLERFLRNEHDPLSRGEWPHLEAFLREEDDCLWDWLQGRKRPEHPGYRALVERICD